MICTKCRARGKTWQGDDPKCAFDDQGLFTADNWNCATLREARSLIDLSTAAWSEDQWCGAIPMADGKFMILGWYKNRGRTESAFVLNETIMSIATLHDFDTLQRPEP